MTEPVSVHTPEAIVLGRSGDLWVTDSELGRILRIAPDGRVRQCIGSSGAAAAAGITRRVDIGDLPLPGVCGLAVSADEQRLYVSAGCPPAVWGIDLALGSARLLASAPERMVTGAPGYPVGARMAAEDGLVGEPRALALDEDADTLYLAMADIRQIWRLEFGAGDIHVLAGASPRDELGHADGSFQEATFARPSGLALAPDRRRLYVADSRAVALRIAHLDEARVSTLVGPADGLSGCSDVAVGPGGFLVVDTGHDTIWGVNPRHHTLVKLWSGRERLNRPRALVFDRAHHGYVVADAGNHRLLRLMRDMSSATEMSLYR